MNFISSDHVSDPFSDTTRADFESLETMCELREQVGDENFRIRYEHFVGHEMPAGLFAHLDAKVLVETQEVSDKFYAGLKFILIVLIGLCVAWIAIRRFTA